MGIDLIFASDALRLPLTGIGRYAYELARRLAVHEDIARLRYFGLYGWAADPLPAIEAAMAADQSAAGRASPRSVRDWLAGNTWAVRAYQSIGPHLSGWQLRGNAKAIYHAPNYVVPPFAGRSVSTVHDLSHLTHPQFHPPARVQYLRAALEESLARVDHVITDSDTVKNELIERGLIARERVTAIHLAVGEEFRPLGAQELAPALHRHGLSAGGYTLFVGTVEPRKNVERLVQAYELLPRDLRRECPLVVAGGKGWNSEAIHARMARAQAEGWLRYLSFVDQRSLPALYAGARLVAYPSLYEGFGLPIIEAMASGTPVLTSSTSCMPEVAGGAARLVNPLDVEDMAHALAECLNDEAWQAEARAKGMIRAAGLSWDRCAEETVAVYKQLA